MLAEFRFCVHTDIVLMGWGLFRSCGRQPGPRSANGGERAATLEEASEKHPRGAQRCTVLSSGSIHSPVLFGGESGAYLLRYDRSLTQLSARPAL